MNSVGYTSLQIREIFHLEFLRWLGRKLEAEHYVLKGGVNLRLFFRSIRYSEDMDIDIQGVRVDRIKKTVMDILSSQGLSQSLKSFGITKVIPPDIMKAKQTETTQRFKIHLLAPGGQDLFTKIEFSRRGMKGTAAVEPVPAPLLRSYKMAPLLAPHYDTASAIQQKIQALAQRSVLQARLPLGMTGGQARDIFDLFVLSSQYNGAQGKPLNVGEGVLRTALDNIFLVEFLQFRDTVAAYLEIGDQRMYSLPAAWDEIKLKTARFLEEVLHGSD